MPYPLQTVTNYAPVYYMVPQYLNYQSPYTDYYQDDYATNQPFYPQYGQTYGITQPYNMYPIIFFKRYVIN